MRRPVLRIAEHRVRGKLSKTSPFVIDGLRVNNKRKRLFFKTRTAAEQELGRIKTKLRQEGDDALKLPDWLRVTSLECTKELEPFGKTIRDATDHYLRYLRDTQKPNITTSELVTHYLAHQRQLKSSAVHQRDLKGRLGRFCLAFGTRTIRSIETREIDGWLRKLKLSPKSLHNYRGRLSGLFVYGMKQGYADSNPVAPIELEKTVEKPPEIFTPDQLRGVLENAPADALPLFAIGAFAGLRAAELLRLEWDNVFKNGHVEVPALKAKSAKRRVIRMSENLQAWLAPYASCTGRIWPRSEASFYDATEKARIAAGLAKWPQNGLRHSFASYHLAKHQNAPQLSLDMGHVNPRMVFDCYREVVMPAEADRYWQIFPPRAAENVVPMAQGVVKLTGAPGKGAREI